MNTVVGVLLAAGAGTRMGRPKGLLRTSDGTPWVGRAVAVLAAGGCDPILAVVGAEAEQVRALVPEPAGIVVAADWSEGMGASLRAALRAAQQQAPAATAVIITLVDTPGVTRETVARLCDELKRLERTGGDGSSLLARAAYGGRPGHPVLIGREHWAGVIEAARGDSGARAYLAGRHVVLVECGDVGSGEDFDTPDSVRAVFLNP